MEELLSLNCQDVKDTELSMEDIEKYLEELEGWNPVDGVSIERRFSFDSFADAIEFVNSVAAIAESEEHHPEIDIRFDMVKITLTTHDEGSLTKCDFIVAAKINMLS